MSYSLNEVEALAKKATRGAGYSWGLAEEASKAVRFLCHHGLDGCAALAGVLDHFDGRACVPVFTDGWRAEAGALCPITLGAALSDRAGTGAVELTVCRDVVQPVLLLPFAAQIARVSGAGVTVWWDAATIATDGRQVDFATEPPDRAEMIQLRSGGKITRPLTQTSRAQPDAEIWERLMVYAHRTYAPATEESRLKGAG